MIDFLASLLQRRRWVFGVLVLALTATASYGYLAGSGLPVLRARSSQDDFAEDRRLLKDVQREFGVRQTDAYLVVDSPELFTAEKIAAVRRAVRAVETLPTVAEVIWLDNLPSLNLFGLSDPLLPKSDAAPSRFAEARKRAIRHPLVGGQLVSRDGTTLMMPVAFNWFYVSSDEEVSSELVATARTAAGDAGLRIRATGEVPLFVAQDDAMKRNQRWFQVIGYALSFVFAVLLFRGVAPVLIVAGAPALGIFWTFGILRVLNEDTNLLTDAVLPVLIAMVGMSDGIHLMVQIRRRRLEGESRLQSCGTAIRNVGMACALTSLTTAIGFASLMVSHLEFVRSFGRACSVGVLVTFASVILVIPLMSSTRFADSLSRHRARDFVGTRLQQLDGLFRWCLGRSRAVSAIGLLSTAVLAVVTLNLRPDSRLSSSLPSSSSAYQALQHCDRAFGGIEMVRLVVEWPESVVADSPQILRAVRAAERIVRNQELLSNPLSLDGILNAFPGDQHDAETRMSYASLIPARLREAYLNPEARRTMITMRIQGLGIARYQPVFQQLRKELGPLEAEFPGFRFRLTGDPVVQGKRLFQIVTDLAGSLGMASVVILVIMGITYRSLRIGLITVVPNLFPLVVTGGLLLVIGQPLEIAAVCSFTVCLGIAVDDTIHFLSRYQREVRRDENHDENHDEVLCRTFHGVGGALVMTTVILVTGFAAVLTSDLPGHRTFAAMACSTIGAALIGDLFFLPAMLKTFHPLRPADKPASDPQDPPRGAPQSV